MGGEGSTRWKGRSVKATVESCTRIEANELRRDGLLEPGRADIVAGFNTFCSGRGTLFLSNAGAVHEINIAEKCCRIGWYRTSFVCPACGRHTGFLYFQGGPWECRWCANLNYTVQQRRPRGRSYRRLLKLWAQLWDPPLSTILDPFEPLPDFKPRRRWSKTFSRLKNQYALELRKFFEMK